jgi:hypothetical protein
MDAQRRSNLIFGTLLLLVGGWFLALQFFPGLEELINFDYEWPLLVVATGAVFFLFALVARAPGLAVPAAIISGIGGLLYYQNSTGDWDSWAYAWALIPGFVGVGVLLSNLLEGRFVRGLREGLSLIAFSLILFGIFGAFLGGPEIFATYWPVLLILWGIRIMTRGIFPAKIREEVGEVDENGEIIYEANKDDK